MSKFTVAGPQLLLLRAQTVHHIPLPLYLINLGLFLLTCSMKCLSRVEIASMPSEGSDLY